MTEQTTKKLAETDRLSLSYVASLYRLLPCLDVSSVAQEDAAHELVHHIASIKCFQRRMEHGFSTGFSDSGSSGEVTVPPTLARHAVQAEVSASLTEAEQAELRNLIATHGFYAAREDGGDVIYVSHSMITGRAHALNEREVYDIVKDVVARMEAQ